MDKPNVVFIMTHDTGKYLGCYGEKVMTPNLDRIAYQGVLFNHYFSTAPVCGPARGALVTGRFPNRSGVGFHGYGPDAQTPMPLHYANNGYNTCLFGLYDEALSIKSLGYDYVYPDGQNQAPQGSQHKAETIMPKAADFILNYNEKKPFFLWIGLFETHRSFDTGHYQPDRTDEASSFYDIKNDEKTKEDLSYFRGSLRAFDNGVGIVLNAIEKSRNSNTIIVYTTDHGIPFPSCKGTLYDRGMNISLLLMWKNRISPHRCNRFLSNIDLFPTLCELCDIQPPDDVDGKSFVGCLLGGDEPEREYVFAQITTHCRFRPERAIRSKKYKYIRKFHQTPGGYMPYDIHTSLSGEAIREELYSLPYVNEELYDLEKDPYERVNLSDDIDLQFIKEELNQKLIDWMVKTEDPILFGKLIPAEFEQWDAEKRSNRLPAALW